MLDIEATEKTEFEKCKDIHSTGMMKNHPKSSIHSTRKQSDSETENSRMLAGQLSKRNSSMLLFLFLKKDGSEEAKINQRLNHNLYFWELRFLLRGECITMS